MSTIKSQILDFVEAHPFCSTKEIEEKFGVYHSSFSLLTGYLLKGTAKDLRHLKPVFVNKRKYQWIVSTEIVKTDSTGWILDYIPSWSKYYKYCKDLIEMKVYYTIPKKSIIL